jgi:hypothetical protein
MYTAFSCFLLFWDYKQPTGLCMQIFCFTDFARSQNFADDANGFLTLSSSTFNFVKSSFCIYVVTMPADQSLIFNFLCLGTRLVLMQHIFALCHSQFVHERALVLFLQHLNYRNKADNTCKVPDAALQQLVCSCMAESVYWTMFGQNNYT